MTKPKTTTRTISININPANGNTGGEISIDIGKYYDYYLTRIVSAWMKVRYVDLTAGSEVEEASGYGRLRDVTNMQLPADQIAIIAGAGTAVVTSGVNFITGIENVFHGDLQLEQPTFRLLVEGIKPTVGGYPASFTFGFDVTLQLEFGVDKIDQDFRPLTK